MSSGSYRARWQIELAFKRLKSLVQLGHLKKHDEIAARAWLQGKLLVAFLVDALLVTAERISPGDTRIGKAKRGRCLWRETSFMLELLSRAVLPVLSLNDAIKDWNRIAHKLAELPRQRVRQTERLHDVLS